MENHARLNTAIAGKKDIADSATQGNAQNSKEMMFFVVSGIFVVIAGVIVGLTGCLSFLFLL